MQLNVTALSDQTINVNTQNAYVLATVSISEALNIVSDVLGWIYFVAWEEVFSVSSQFAFQCCILKIYGVETIPQK